MLVDLIIGEVNRSLPPKLRYAQESSVDLGFEESAMIILNGILHVPSQIKTII